jgi:hypothetical protein
MSNPVVVRGGKKGHYVDVAANRRWVPEEYDVDGKRKNKGR